MKEYWIIDPIRRETLFHQLNDLGVYDLVRPDGNGIYHSKVLGRFKMAADIFWRKPLPGGIEMARMVEDMLRA